MYWKTHVACMPNGFDFTGQPSVQITQSWLAVVIDAVATIGIVMTERLHHLIDVIPQDSSLRAGISHERPLYEIIRLICGL